MKRVKQVGLVLVMVLAIVGVTGCVASKEEQEKLMKEYATKYYNDYMIGYQENNGEVQELVVQVSISMLKQANELGEDNYKLSKLSNCSDYSYVELTINQENKNIEKYQFNLKCD